jgi:predicted nucleic acid-binding protein
VRAGQLVFVDTGAWIALALTADPLHARARDAWQRLRGDGVLLRTSVPVVLETFTFLDRHARRDVALAWKHSLKSVRRLKILPSTARHLELAWPYFERTDLHKLSAVDAVSFVLMTEHRIHVAFAFDAHFATAGFRMVG